MLLLHLEISSCRRSNPLRSELVYVWHNRSFWQVISTEINTVEPGGGYRHTCLLDFISHAWYAVLLLQLFWLYQSLSVSLGVN